jgi:hypothetical protein
MRGVPLQVARSEKGSERIRSAAQPDCAFTVGSHVGHGLEASSAKSKVSSAAREWKVCLRNEDLAASECA